MSGDPLTTVLSRLGEVRRSGGGYIARCPAHADHNPSLKVDPAEDGKVLLKCFADCSVEDILKALGLTMSDLFPRPAEQNAPPGEIVTKYEYRDADGTLLYQVLRKKPKGFVQRHPDGEGGWLWDMKGVKRVPYLLPNLLTAQPDAMVYIPEGEKDVNRLAALGLVATCNSGGAGKWLDSYSEALVGRHCVILPDNDEPGRSHAQKVALSLRSYAASIKIVELPGLAPGADVTDWIESGGTVEALQALADDASQVDFSSFSRFSNNRKERNENGGGFRFATVSELLAEPEQDIDYLVDDLLPAGGVGLIAAKPKVGKSTTVRKLILSVARGEPFLGRNVKQGPVIYLGLEEMRSGVAHHFRGMGAEDEPIYIHVGAAPQEALTALSEAIALYDAKLAVVDPLLRLIRVKDINDYAEVTRALEPWVDLARTSGCHILFIHHMTKGDRLSGDSGDAILGSTALFGAVDTAMLMKSRDETRTLETIQRYGSKMPATVILMDPETGDVTAGGDFDAMQLESVGKQILHVLVDGPLTEADIKDRVGGNTGLCGKALRQLRADGLVHRAGGGRRGDPYIYSRAMQG